MHPSPRQPHEKITMDQKKKVLTKAFIRMTHKLSLTRLELKAIIGSSESSLSRLFRKTSYLIDPSTKEGQLAILLLRFYKNLDVLFGGNESQCQLWLRSENKHLSGKPIDIIRSIEGLIIVIQYLDAMRGKN